MKATFASKIFETLKIHSTLIQLISWADFTILLKAGNIMLLIWKNFATKM